MGFKREMDEREWRFCHAYARSLNKNGAAAARDAGFPISSAKTAACLMLKRDDIKAALAEIEARAMPWLDITTERTKQELAAIAYMDPGQFMNVTKDGEVVIDVKNLPVGAWRLVTEIKQDEFLDRSGDKKTATDKKAPVVKGQKKSKRVRRTTIKFASKLQALVALASIQGIKGAVTDPNKGASEAGRVDPLHKRAASIQKKLKEQDDNVVAIS